MPIQFNLEPYKTNIFIETGTYRGGGCINAIESGFNEIHSIEIHAPMLEVAKRNLQPYVDKVNINLYLGDSSDTLSIVLANINEPATIWLDGHDASTDGGGRGKKGCPLYEELDAIKNHHIKEHIIMIDDLRIINTDNQWGETDISLKGIKNKLKEINSNYEFFYENGHIENDCLIARVLVNKKEE
jgi:hypothetical protein